MFFKPRFIPKKRRFCLLCNGCQLQDCFEDFRSFCYANDGIDVTHSVTLPSHTFQAMLLQTHVHLEIVQPDIQPIFSSKIIGAWAGVLQKHVVSHHPGVEGSDYKDGDDLVYQDMFDIR